MKKAASFLKPFSSFSSRWFSSRAPRGSTTPGGPATGPSSSTATARSGRFAGKRPSFCLQLAFLALGVSAYLALQTEGAEAVDPELSRLEARGWIQADSSPPCESLESGRFYEVDSEEGTKEFYFISQEIVLAPPPGRWPEPPAVCHPIQQPGFVQEIE